MGSEQKQSSLFASDEAKYGIYTDKEIIAAVQQGDLIAPTTFERNCTEASSYDIRVGQYGVVGGTGIVLDLARETMELGPGSYGGVISAEKLTLPDNVAARLGSKRSLSYDGVILLSGTIVDPGYKGHLLFGLYNASQRRVHIRKDRKLCNLIFERLTRIPEKTAPSDPELQQGRFPAEFLDRMANMDVLPWMQISDRIKQIEIITKDIIDLKARYEDVLKPIRDLTQNVESLTKDVASLTEKTRSVAHDIEQVNAMVAENSKQISQLTANMGTLGAQIGGVSEKTKELAHAQGIQGGTLQHVQSNLNFWRAFLAIVGSLILLGLGALLPEVFRRLFGQ